MGTEANLMRPSLHESFALFGGTFDPIHFGHINLAIELKERCNLSKVLFCPSFLTPGRNDLLPGSALHRLEMVKLAIEDITGFECFDQEIVRQGVSYTIDTVKKILEIYPETKNRLYLILGEDVAPFFDQWRSPKEILHLVQPLIGSRTLEKTCQRWEKLDIDNEIKNALVKGLTPIHLLDISATTVRERLKKNLYCGHLVPGKVLDYIYENKLYF